jgi:DNA-binding NarL/FixJ family response regulator
MPPLTLILADDHPIVRHGLRMILEAEGDLRILEEVEEGGKVVEAVARLRPDVLILDVMLPDVNGLKVLPDVRAASPSTRTVVLSMYTSEEYILEALKNGAMGYVPKSASATLLVDAVRTVAAGRRYLSPPFSERAIELYLQRVDSGPLDVFDTLTKREVEIFKWMAQGYRNAEISAQLSISSRTVEVHRARIMQKLDLSSTRELIQFALQRGMLTVEAPDQGRRQA